MSSVQNRPNRASFPGRVAGGMLAVLTPILAAGIVWSASASAEVSHPFSFSFTGADTPQGAFSEGTPHDLAVSQSTGDVYVEDSKTGDVYRFDSAGKYVGEITGADVPQGSLGLFLGASGVAVDNSGGPNDSDVYVAGTEHSVVYRFDENGLLLGEITGAETPGGEHSFEPWGLAVAPNGDLYVGDAANSVIDEFNSSGVYIGRIENALVHNATSLAVDGLGDLYVTSQESGERRVVEIEPGGATSVLNAKGYTVAADTEKNVVYVGEVEFIGGVPHGQVVEYNSAGKRLGSFGEAQSLEEIGGLATRDSTGEVYAADARKHNIDVYGAPVVAAEAVTLAPSAIGSSTATLNGTVDPETVAVTSCSFEYGTSTTYGQSVPCVQSPASIGSGASPVPVSAEITGLKPGSEYHYRLVITNADSRSVGSDVAFTTTGAPVVVNQSTSGRTHTEATLEAKINPDGLDTTYHFEYGTSTAYGTSVPIPDADIGSSHAAQAVGQHIGGLSAGVVYHYRVVATNSFETVDGQDAVFTAVPPASIDAEYATGVAATSATLSAEINPIESATTYTLEYGTTAGYGQSVAGGSIGEGSSDVTVEDRIQDLQASTLYHYRFVAANTVGIVDGADHTFTTQPAGAGGALVLPDGRQWELVSPSSKRGASFARSASDVIEAAGAGGGMTYGASEPVGENEPAGKNRVSQILSVREPDGWHSRDISPPNTLAGKEMFEEGEQIRFFSQDLSSAAVEQDGPFDALSSSPQPVEGRLYLRNNSTEEYEPLLTGGDVPEAAPFNEYREKEGGGSYQVADVLGGTPDLSQLVIGSWLALTPEAVQGHPDEFGRNRSQNLYMWNGGALRMINVPPSASENPSPNAFLAGEFPNAAYAGTGQNAVSADGRWVAWTIHWPSFGHYTQVGSDEAKYRGLFVRDMTEGRTLPVGGLGSVFQMLSADGSTVFYIENGELYAFDTATATETDLTAAHGFKESSAGTQEAVLGTSEDGSYVYFVATGVLGGAPGATAGEDNLYVAHRQDGAWNTSFIATLSSEDEPSWYEKGFAEASTYASRGWLHSRVSPNGRYLTFMSGRSLTGYDNADANSGAPDDEVYLYDSVAGRLVCASCNPSGARPTGLAVGSENYNLTFHGLKPTKGVTRWIAGMTPAGDENRARSYYQPRYLSNSGRLFFDSADALVGGDTNGVMDAYQYEPVGVGGCTTEGATYSERADGCIGLISSGTSSEESTFFDASENGDDAFFLTARQLTTADVDNSLDVYDAHVCSPQSPCVAPPPVSPPPCSTGDSCRSAPAPQPETFGAPPSATFSGAGNVVSPTTSVVARKPASTRAQKLARALANCKKVGSRAKRRLCERTVRRRYGASRRGRKAVTGGKVHGR